MTPRFSLVSVSAGLVLCCVLSTSSARGGEPTIQVIPAVRHLEESDRDSSTVTPVGWRHFGHHARHAYRHSYGWHGHSYYYGGWGHGVRYYSYHRPYASSYYYGGYTPYYTSYSAPTYYAPTYSAPRYAPAYYAPSYTVRYAPVVYSYRPAFYYAPRVRVLYGGYGYYYPGYY